MASSFRTIVFRVTFKYEPSAIQESTTFSSEAAAYALAITVEKDGGVAVVTTEYKDEPIRDASRLSF